MEESAMAKSAIEKSATSNDAVQNKTTERKAVDAIKSTNKKYEHFSFFGGADQEVAIIFDSRYEYKLFYDKPHPIDGFHYSNAFKGKKK
ncbi:hypothetical protein PUN28_003935 [Cardiocondyla obscurior]|uniref:Uncharacterized protein n=1 Tax=Cardiocondyla obscurior TaxID=286306 RepID=A0AAW2GLJ8_9HYME